MIELPFLVPSALRGSQALWGLYKDGTLADEYKEYKVLALFVHNPGLIHTKDKRVVNLADLKGLRLRVAQQHGRCGPQLRRRRAGGAAGQ